MADSQEPLPADNPPTGRIPPAEYVRQANADLAALRHLEARWWHYSVSHCTLDLVVGDCSAADNLVLCLAGCEHICGPVRWPAQRIEVKLEVGSPGSGPYTLHDPAVGFRAVGGLFRWRRGWDLWATNGLWIDRNTDPSRGQPLETVLGWMEEHLREYYAGKISYADLAYHLRTTLWHSLPAVRQNPDARQA